MEDRADIFEDYKRLRLEYWQQPHVLFLAFAVLMIVTTHLIISSFIGAESLAMVWVIISMTLFLMIFGYFIISSFDKVVQASRREAEFISLATHQLRTPLSNFRWTLELLERKLKTQGMASARSGAAELIRSLFTSTNSMIQSIEALLEMSRLESGTLEFKATPFSLYEMTRKEVDAMQKLAATKNFVLRLHAPAQDRQVEADKTKVRMVIENLMENAIKYSPQGKEIVIAIESAPYHLRWSIADNGIGVEKEIQHAIFEKFFRGDNAKRAHPQGLGLGLYIAKAIVEMSGGNMGVISKKGKGSTFWFTLPLSS